MHVEGPLDRILSAIIPHEVTHTVFADAFGGPLPRWADEGGATLSEDAQALREEYGRLCEILRTPGRALSLRRLFSLRDYPPDVMPVYAEGCSVAGYLVARADRPTFLRFVVLGMSAGWDPALRTCYRLDSVEALQSAWLSALRSGTATPRLAKSRAEAPAGSVAVRAVVRIPSHGCSGTVISSRRGWSLILTSAAPFAGEARERKIVVDGPAQPDAVGDGPVRARIVALEATADLCLIELNYGPCATAPVATSDRTPEGLLSVGYDRMAWPVTVRPAGRVSDAGELTATEDLPGDGRCGGALLDPRDGRLVGVVQGRDANSGRGLYVSLPTVWVWLARQRQPPGVATVRLPTAEAFVSAPSLPRTPAPASWAPAPFPCAGGS